MAIAATARADRELDWFALSDRLRIATEDTKRELKQRRLRSLYREVHEADVNLRLKEILRNQTEAGRGTMDSAPPVVSPTVQAPAPTVPPANQFVKTEKSSMSITGLQSGAFQAKLAEMRQKMLDKQNAGLAKVDAATTAASAKIDAAIDNATAKIDKEVDDSLQEFAQFTNGGPA